MIRREDVADRLRNDMASTLRDYGIDPRKREHIGPGLVEALVEDAMHQVDKALEGNVA